MRLAIARLALLTLVAGVPHEAAVAADADLAPRRCARREGEKAEAPAEPPVVRVSGWGGGRTGFQFEATLNAMHRAACCAGTASLPSSAPVFRIDGRAAPRRTCFDFSHLRRVSRRPCAPASARSSAFFYGGVSWANRGPCPSNFYYLKAATIAAAQYADLQPRRCAASYGSTLVAHVRAGDQFRRAAKPGEEAVHAGYGQPPLAYYLSAYLHARRSSAVGALLVVAEDDSNPVVKLLEVLSATLPGAGIEVRVGGSFASDLGSIMCASHLVLARSSLQTLFLTNPRLRTVYTHARPEDDLWAGSCDTRVLVAQEAARERRWTASHAQQLALLVAHHGGANLTWRAARPRCLGQSGAGLQR